MTEIKSLAFCISVLLTLDKRNNWSSLFCEFAIDQNKIDENNYYILLLSNVLHNEIGFTLTNK